MFAGVVGSSGRRATVGTGSESRAVTPDGNSAISRFQVLNSATGVGVNIKHPGLLFFLLPFFMLSGVALQSAGLYLCLVVWMFFVGDKLAFAPRRATLSTASILIVSYLLPIAFQSVLGLFENPLRSCVIDPPRVLTCELSLRSWFKSPMSSATVGIGVGWALFIFTRNSATTHGQQINVAALNVVNDDEARVTAFSKGLLLSSALLFAYCVFQHRTGYSLLLKSRLLEPEHQMANGFYRAFGFYGHPLSLAGSSLVWLSFGLWGMLSEFRKRNLASGLSLPLWFLVSTFHFSLIYMSGGRTALAVAFLMIGMLLMTMTVSALLVRLSPQSHVKQNKKLKKYLLPFSIGFLAFLGALPFLFSSDLVKRILSFVHVRGTSSGTMGQGLFGDRELFWQVYLAMWRDAPFLGQGDFAVRHGVRTQYYFQEGFADLRDKFGAHNIFLEVLGTMGVVGLFSYIVLCVLLFLNLKILAGRSQQRLFVLKALLIAFAANLLHGLTQNTFFDSSVSACYLAILGIFVVPSLAQSSKQEVLK